MWFWPIKKKFDEKNGSNSPNFEKKKLKSPDFYNKFQLVAKNRFLMFFYFHIWHVARIGYISF
jgi:hypothetical protein